MDRKFWNVILLGIGFMLLFTAFQTMGNIEVSLESDRFFFIYNFFLPAMSYTNVVHIVDSERADADYTECTLIHFSPIQPTVHLSMLMLNEMWMYVLFGCVWFLAAREQHDRFVGVENCIIYSNERTEYRRCRAGGTSGPE